MQAILMVTGVPGSGKTTLLRSLLRSLWASGISIGQLSEYEFVKEWADRRENRSLLLAPPPSFVLQPEGYRPMSRFVAGRLVQAIRAKFQAGINRVAFETARGVGEPLVTYREFVRDIYAELGEEGSGVGLVHYEVVAPREDVERRTALRFAEDPSAPPPGIELRYLTAEGKPRISAREDLVHLPRDFPLLFNETLSNGRDVEGFKRQVVEAIVPRVLETLGFGSAREGPVSPYPPERR